jgi:purine-cytosine permease-like protein
VVLIVWVAGNVAMALGLRHHADALRDFEATASVGSTFTNPVALVAGCALLLVIAIVIAGIAWQTTFGFRGPGRLENALAIVLLLIGLVLDGFLLLRTSFIDVQHVRQSASVAGWAAVAGALLLILASVRRR